MKLVIVPRWGGTGESDFYPWLAARIAEELGAVATAVELLPSRDAPRPEETTANVRSALNDPGQTILLAYSVGCRAAVAAAAELAVPLRGRVCVAGWFTIDQPWPTILPWLEMGPASRPRAQSFKVLLSGDDPFTADHRATGSQFEALARRWKSSTAPGTSMRSRSRLSSRRWQRWPERPRLRGRRHRELAAGA